MFSIQPSPGVVGHGTNNRSQVVLALPYYPFPLARLGLMWWPFRRSEPDAASAEASAWQRIADLTQSRRVIVDAYEVERQRIERDLHDGVQQYLVTAMMKLGEARLAPAVIQNPELDAQLKDIQHTITTGLEELRKTVRGIHPQVLVELGLVAALEDVAAASSHPIQVVCPNPLPKIPEGVLAAAYFLATEAITNATKYAPGSPVTVLVAADDNLRISVMDQGPGGAHFRSGGGLEGMRERLAAFGGELSVSSPAGGPTQIRASIPLLLHRGESGVLPSPEEQR